MAELWPVRPYLPKLSEYISPSATATAHQEPHRASTPRQGEARAKGRAAPWAPLPGPRPRTVERIDRYFNYLGFGWHGSDALHTQNGALS